MALFVRRFAGVARARCSVEPQSCGPFGARLLVLQHRARHTDVGATHFRLSHLEHPLQAKPHQQVQQSQSQHMEPHEAQVVKLMANQVWSKEEIDDRLHKLHTHKPHTFSDRLAHGVMSVLYKTFNAVTGFKEENTPVKAVEWRLIVLESFAGVPGFMAAMFRHFRSLRRLKRDHGWIHTLLEEAENERMHLLICMRMFDADVVTRTLVICAQLVMTPMLATVYLLQPRAVHRFVGYLEETACHTYANIIRQIETPGTPLHKEWSQLPAPKLARTYYKLDDEAMWVDCLKCMFADESNHRDVNHTFATMDTDDPNPFVDKHQANAVHAWRLEQEGATSDVGLRDPKVSKILWPISGGMSLKQRVLKL